MTKAPSHRSLTHRCMGIHLATVINPVLQALHR